MSTFEKIPPSLMQNDKQETIEKRLEAFKNPEFCCVLGEQLLQKNRPDAALTGDFDQLKTMRLNMRDKLLGSNACDTATFARSMEKLYFEFWEYRN